MKIDYSIIDKADWYLEIVNRLPNEKSRENFRGFMTNIGKKDTASPKQIVPKCVALKNCILTFSVTKNKAAHESYYSLFLTQAW